MKPVVHFTVLDFFFFLVFTSCVKDVSLKPTDYVKWVENHDNGLLVTKNAGDFKFKLQYKPPEYLAIRELKKTEISSTELSEKASAMEDMQYFTLQLGLADGSDILKSNIEKSGDFSRNIEYLSFYMQQDLKLVEGADTLPCLLHHFERDYGISQFAKIVLAFQKSNNVAADKTLIFNDRQFGAGTVSMTILSQSLNNLPKIKTK